MLEAGLSLDHSLELSLNLMVSFVDFQATHPKTEHQTTMVEVGVATIILVSGACETVVPIRAPNPTSGGCRWLPWIPPESSDIVFVEIPSTMSGQ